MWEAINGAFDAMPLAAEVDGKVFCTHGGIPHPDLMPTGVTRIADAVNAIPCPLKLERWVGVNMLGGEGVPRWKETILLVSISKSRLGTFRR